MDNVRLRSISPLALAWRHRYLLLGICVSAGVLYLSLAAAMPPPADLIPPAEAVSFQRQVYLAFIVLVLPVCYFLAKSFPKRPSAEPHPLFRMGAIAWVSLFIAMIPAVRSLGGQVLRGGIDPTFLVAAIAVFAAILIFEHRRTNASQVSLRLAAWRASVAMGAFVIFFSCASGVTAVIYDNTWMMNFDAVVYSVSQVSAGKTLLADLPAQYGLYAEFLGPIVREIGFSVPTVTGILGALSVGSFLSIAVVIQRNVRSWPVRLTWILSAVLLSNFVWAHINDPYLQYFPLRTFFPCLSVWLFWRYLVSARTAMRPLAFGSMAGIAMAWNLDSGIPVLGAFLAYLGLSALYSDQRARRVFVRHALATILGCGLTLAVFAAYIELSAENTVHWSEALHYQKVFYLQGAYALLVPSYPHPWMAVIAVYVVCIVGYMRTAKTENERSWSLCLYAAILGLGLFPYYQHRAHDFVLSAVAWPALFCAALLADKMLDRIRNRGWVSVDGAVLMPAFIASILLGGYFIWLSPLTASTVVHHARSLFDTSPTPFTRDLDFVRSHITGEEHGVAIIAPNQGSFYGSLGLGSPIRGPGAIESFSNVDQNKMAQNLLRSSVEKLFLKDVPSLDMKNFKPILERYDLKDTSQDGLKYYRLSTSVMR